MAKRKVDEITLNAVKAFVLEVSKHYKVDAAILFGSFAKGRQNENSDIDVAIVSHDIQNTFDDMVKMMSLRWNVDLRIEPHPIKTEEFYKKETPFIAEIIKTGIPIYA